MPKPSVRVWLDDGSGAFDYNITPYVDLRKGVSITRGRQDEFGEVQASTCSMTLDNTDSRFTFGSITEPIQVDTGILVETSIGALTASRFMGYVNQWPVTWPGGNRYSEVQITASDRFARLARRKLQSVPGATIMAVGPKVYYPLTESSDATSAGDRSGRGAPALQIVQMGSGGTIDFGSGTGPPTDGASAPMFARVDPLNGQYLSAALSGGVLPYSPDVYLLAVVNTADVSQTFVRVAGPGYPIEIGVDAFGKPTVRYGSSAIIGGAASIADGGTHTLLFTWVDATSTATLYVDNVSVASSSANYLWPDTYSNLMVGGGDASYSRAANATISHVAVGQRTLTATERGDLHHAMIDGFTADSSDERITRYAGWAGIASADVSAGGGMLAAVAHQDTTGMSVLAAMQNVTTSEQGLLFINGAGKLVFHPRSHRYAPAIDATLDAHDIGADSLFSLDTQTLINSVTASREGGATQLYEVASSVAKYEQYPSDLSLLVTTDDDALLAASWVANTNAEPTPRLSSVPVDLLTQDEATAADVMFLELGDAIAITGLPYQAPAPSVSLFVEGWQEEISTDQWSITFNTSPLNTVWKLQDPISGAIDRTFRLAY